MTYPPQQDPRGPLPPQGQYPPPPYANQLPPPAYPPPPYPGPPHAGLPYTAPPAVRAYRPPGGLGIAAVALAVLTTLVELVEVPLAGLAGDELADAARAGVAAAEVPTLYDFVSVVAVAALVAAWIVTAVWLTRARANAEAQDPGSHHARSRVWAWLGWVVPVVSLWFPFQFVRDVRRATWSPQRRQGSLVGWWWAAWLVYLVSMRVGEQITNNQEPDELMAQALGPVEAVNAVAAVVAVVLWARIVQQVSRRQEEVARATRG